MYFCYGFKSVRLPTNQQSRSIWKYRTRNSDIEICPAFYSAIRGSALPVSSSRLERLRPFYHTRCRYISAYKSRVNHFQITWTAAIKKPILRENNVLTKQYWMVVYHIDCGYLLYASFHKLDCFEDSLFCDLYWADYLDN